MSTTSTTHVIGKIKGGVFANTDIVGFGAEQSAISENCYPDDLGNNLKRFGLNEWKDARATFGAINGMFFWEKRNQLIVVTSAGGVWAVNYDKTITDIHGTTNLSANSNVAIFAHDDRSLFIANGGLVGQIVKFDDMKLLTSTLVPYIPTKVTHVAYVKGYLVGNEIGSQKFYFAQPEIFYSGYKDKVLFASAEMDSDNVIALHNFWDELFLFGTKTIEVWRQDGSTPFSRIPGAEIQMGCGAPYSIIRAGDTVYWLNEHREIVRLNGRQPEKVSSPFQRLLDGYSSITDGFSYLVSHNGRNWIFFSSPTADTTIAYDYELNQWWRPTSYTSGANHMFRPKTAVKVYSAPSYNDHESDYANTGADMGGIGTIAWTNPNYIAVDGRYAYLAVASGALRYSRYLRASNFDFSQIPASATLTGITVTWTVANPGGTSGMGFTKDYVAKLVDASGTVVGNNKATNVNISAIGALSYGGENDMWGTSLTVANLKDVDFGSVLSVEIPASTTISLHISKCEITAHYTVDYTGKQFSARSSVILGAHSDGVLWEPSSGVNVNFPKWIDETYNELIPVVRTTGLITYNTHNKKRCDKLVLRFKRGVGITTIEPAPTCSIRWLDNQGDTWSSPITVSLGGVGTDQNMFVVLHRLGIYKSRQYEISYSGNCEFIFVEADEYVTILDM